MSHFENLVLGVHNRKTVYLTNCIQLIENEEDLAKTDHSPENEPWVDHWKPIPDFTNCYICRHGIVLKDKKKSNLLYLTVMMVLPQLQVI